MKNSSQFFHDLNRLRLQCVNGDWINSLGATSLKGLACESCVQVGASGYAAFDERDEQEISFFFVVNLWKLFLAISHKRFGKIEAFVQRTHIAVSMHLRTIFIENLVFLRSCTS